MIARKQARLLVSVTACILLCIISVETEKPAKPKFKRSHTMEEPGSRGNMQRRKSLPLKGGLRGQKSGKDTDQRRSRKDPKVNDLPFSGSPLHSELCFTRPLTSVSSPYHADGQAQSKTQELCRKEKGGCFRFLREVASHVRVGSEASSKTTPFLHKGTLDTSAFLHDASKQILFFIASPCCIRSGLQRYVCSAATECRIQACHLRSPFPLLHRAIMTLK
jgi:hypothetical protein